MPSVTTILKVIDKSGPLMGWALKIADQVWRGAVEPDTPYPEIYLAEVSKRARRAHKDVKEEAANIGTQAHRQLEKQFRGELVFPTENDAVENCVAAANQWLREHDVRPMEIERICYSKKYRYSGTLDQISLVDGELALLDWKSSKAIYPEYRLQTAAYVAAYEEEMGTKIRTRYLVRLGKEDGQFEALKLEGRGELFKDLGAFRGALALYNRLNYLNKAVSSRSGFNAQTI